MSSSVFYRFKSQKEPSRVTFDGTGISVFELKREIINQSHLGDGTDFELLIVSEDTGEEYEDDTWIVPRSTTVIAKRLPAAKPGRGGAARYVVGKMPTNAKVSSRSENAAKAQPSKISGSLKGASNEDDRIAAMLQMGADDWAQQQRQMASATPVFRVGGAKGKPHNVSDRPLPSGYVCNRCGEKGHWIWDCPTNNDPTYDGRPRIKRTTGIPKSFLKTVEKPVAPLDDSQPDEKKQLNSVMVNSEGEWVVAEPDRAAWDKFQAQTKTSVAAHTAAAHGNKELQERGLECPIDKRMFVEPTKTPCCGTTYCHECIQNALIDGDLRCPHCSTDNVPIDDLVPDQEKIAAIRQYERDQQQAAELNPDTHTSPTKDDDKGHSERDTATNLALKVATTEVAESAEGAVKQGRKRAAESEIPDERQGKSPKPTSRKADLGSHGQTSSSSSIDLSMPSSGPNLTAAPTTKQPDVPGAGVFPPFGMPPNFGMPNPMMLPGPPFAGQAWNPLAWPTGNVQNPFMHGNAFAGPQNFNNPAFMKGGIPYNAPPNMGNRFANQQRSHNEEDSAYFRRPVNPNRQHNRRNWNQNRPTDYREV